MPPAVPPPPVSTRRKPRVVVVYSQKSCVTSTGRNNALFIGASMQLSGWADVMLLPFSAGKGKASSSRAAPSSSSSASLAPCIDTDGKQVVDLALPITIIPYEGGKPRQAKPAECRYVSWADSEALSDASMFLLCVDPGASASAAQALRKVLRKGQDAAVLSLQQGVMNFGALKDALDEKKVLLLDGAVGFTAVLSGDPAHPPGTLLCLNPHGALVVQRLSKERAASGIKFLNLLSYAGPKMRYAKNVTPCTWGVVVHSLVHASFALCSSTSLREHLRDKHARLVWAALLRESREILAKAAQRVGSDWQLENSCGLLSFVQLERLLCLPSVLFVPLSLLLLPVPRGAVPAVRSDLAAGRESELAWSVWQLEDRARHYKVHAPVLKALAGLLTAAQAVDKGGGKARDRRSSSSGSSSSGSSGVDSSRAGRFGAVTPRGLFEALGQPVRARQAMHRCAALWVGTCFTLVSVWFLVLSPSLNSFFSTPGGEGWGDSGQKR